MEVEEEGDPGGGLVLRHRRDDGDVDLGVAGKARRVQKLQRKGRTLTVCEVNPLSRWRPVINSKQNMP